MKQLSAICLGNPKLNIGGITEIDRVKVTLTLVCEFGWTRSTRQQQQDCIMQPSIVSAHCLFVCLCCCWVNAKVLGYGFCEL